MDTNAQPMEKKKNEQWNPSYNTHTSARSTYEKWPNKSKHLTKFTFHVASLG